MSAHRSTGSHVHHLHFCKNCDRFYDTREGCPADIRFDQQQLDAKTIEAMADAADAGAKKRGAGRSDKGRWLREAAREITPDLGAARAAKGAPGAP